MTIITRDNLHKWEISQVSEDTYKVKFFERMGNRWVALGPADYYSKEALEWEFDIQI